MQSHHNIRSLIKPTTLTSETQILAVRGTLTLIKRTYKSTRFISNQTIYSCHYVERAESQTTNNQIIDKIEHKADAGRSGRNKVIFSYDHKRDGVDCPPTGAFRQFPAKSRAIYGISVAYPTRLEILYSMNALLTPTRRGDF